MSQLTDRYVPPEIVVRDDGNLARAAFADPNWTCPACGGRGGAHSVDDAGYSCWEPCPCREDYRRVELFNDSIIGRRYRDATLDTFEPRNDHQRFARDAALSFSRNYPNVRKGKVFWGPIGSGKTHLALGIARDLTLIRGRSCRFVDFGNLLQDLKRAFSSREADGRHIHPLINVEVLIIDELGKGLKTDWEESVLDDLISRRYNANRYTLATTNYEPSGARAAQGIHPGYDRRAGYTETLEERIGARIFSRLCEMCDFVQVDGEDHRRTRRR